MDIVCAFIGVHHFKVDHVTHHTVFVAHTIATQHVGVHLLKAQHRAPDYLTLNPAGLVPTLVADDGAVLTQCLAIMEYLDEMMPESAPLLPKGAVDRAHVRSLALSLVCDVHPLNKVRVLSYLTSELGVTA